MSNPFLRRATEYFQDDAAFLSIVSPEPLKMLLADWCEDGLYLDMPTRVIGNPGSGKTMMASLVEFRMVELVLGGARDPSMKGLAHALSSCGFTNGKKPLVAATRLPMEAEYRDFWELPYEENVRSKLVYSLIQARCILGWIRNLLTNQRRSIDDIKFTFRPDSEAQIEQIGGISAQDIFQRARAVERAIYKVGASLFPPKIEAIPKEARDPYQPFEAITGIEVDWDGQTAPMKPLIILDDVHTLHPKQLQALFRFLTKREIGIGRWMMMRKDALTPQTVLGTEDQYAGLKKDRDYLDINFQKSKSRVKERNRFRNMASDMAGRYLRKVATLRDRNHDELAPLLLNSVNSFTPERLKKLEDQVLNEQYSLNVTDQRREKILQLIDDYAKTTQSNDLPQEVRLGMLRVLQNRYAKRIAKQTIDLFEQADPEPAQSLKADSDVAEAARIFLHASYGRPFHFGINDVCDASNENAELFLHFAGALVTVMETRVIGRRPPSLPSELQQTELRKRAREIMQAWQFPYVNVVRNMIDQIVADCLADSLAANAPRGAGTNAIAILEQDFEKLDNNSLTAQALKYALAYGAIVVVREHGQGGKLWCLIEMSGLVCLGHGLTLKRGGFLLRSLKDLNKLVTGAAE